MKTIKGVLVVLVVLLSVVAKAQTSEAPKKYAHKVVVDSIIQTKAYTYINVREIVAGKDVFTWMALPLFEPKFGGTYYYESGLQMGQFHSKELDRDFENITFIGFLSTTEEVLQNTIVPAPPVDTVAENTPPPVVHTVLIKEILNAGGYTYLRVIEEGKEEWLAIVKSNVEVGKRYTYEDAAPMKQFKSHELNRTFDEVLFVAKLTKVEGESGYVDKPVHDIKGKKGKDAPKVEAPVKVEAAIPVKLAELWGNPKSFENKTVRLTGTVTRYSENILGQNWIHLVDGTSANGKSDIVVILGDKLKVGDKISVEGFVSVDKDFGSGYKFEALVEGARVVSGK